MRRALVVVAFGVLAAGLSYVAYETWTAKQRADASTFAGVPPVVPGPCTNGVKLCPNNCLKREADGWRSAKVRGHPDTDRWMPFKNADGKTTAYNQNHVGHVIEMVDGRWTDVGVCPVCRGTTVVCK